MNFNNGKILKSSILYGSTLGLVLSIFLKTPLFTLFLYIPVLGQLFYLLIGFLPALYAMGFGIASIVDNIIILILYILNLYALSTLVVYVILRVKYRNKSFKGFDKNKIFYTLLITFILANLVVNSEDIVRDQIIQDRPILRGICETNFRCHISLESFSCNRLTRKILSWPSYKGCNESTSGYKDNQINVEVCYCKSPLQSN